MYIDNDTHTSMASRCLHTHTLSTESPGNENKQAIETNTLMSPQVITGPINMATVHKKSSSYQYECIYLLTMLWFDHREDSCYREFMRTNMVHF